MSPAGLRPKKDCAAEETTDNYRPDFSSERAPHINKPVSVKK
jgi:hypothetical protein